MNMRVYHFDSPMDTERITKRAFHGYYYNQPTIANNILIFVTFCKTFPVSLPFSSPHQLRVDNLYLLNHLLSYLDCLRLKVKHQQLETHIE